MASSGIFALCRCVRGEALAASGCAAEAEAHRLRFADTKMECGGLTHQDLEMGNQGDGATRGDDDKDSLNIQAHKQRSHYDGNNRLSLCHNLPFQSQKCFLADLYIVRWIWLFSTISRDTRFPLLFEGRIIFLMCKILLCHLSEFLLTAS